MIIVNYLRKINNKFNLTREQNVFVAKINVVDWLLKDE
jgi:hypothetical protein